MDEICEVVITAPSADWLAEFSRRLVDDRLCAAAQNIAPIRSVYRWQGQIYDKTEARVALHTRTSLVPQIIERTNEEHPYEVPCVVATAITKGGPHYVAWVLAETAPQPPEPQADDAAYL